MIPVYAMLRVSKLDLRAYGGYCRILSSSVKMTLAGLQKSLERSRVEMNKTIWVNVII